MRFAPYRALGDLLVVSVRPLAGDNSPSDDAKRSGMGFAGGQMDAGSEAKTPRHFSATIAGRRLERRWLPDLGRCDYLVSGLSLRQCGLPAVTSAGMEAQTRVQAAEVSGSGNWCGTPVVKKERGHQGRTLATVCQAPRCDCGKSTRTVLSHGGVHRVRWRAWALGSRGRTAKQAYWLIAAALAQAEPRNLAKTNASVDVRADHRHPISTVASAG